MPYDFRTDRYHQEQHDHALIAPTVRHNSTLPPDYTARLTCDVRVDDLTSLKAGAMCEVVGEYARFWGGQLVLTSAESGGVMHPALSLVERYTPEACEMVVSAFTGALVPAGSGTARRMMREMEMVK